MELFLFILAVCYIIRCRREKRDRHKRLDKQCFHIQKEGKMVYILIKEVFGMKKGTVFLPTKGEWTGKNYYQPLADSNPYDISFYLDDKEMDELSEFKRADEIYNCVKRIDEPLMFSDIIGDDNG